MQTVKQ